MLKKLQVAGIAVVIAAVVIFALDYVQLRVRVWRNANAFGSITVEQYYAIHEKNNKTEYMFNQQPQSQTCVHSLFPHMGYSPCWYLNRNREQRVDI